MIRRTPNLNNKLTPILITILFVTIIVSISSILITLNNHKKEQTNKYIINDVELAYQCDPSVFEFNENNIAILKVDTLIKGVKDMNSSIIIDLDLYTKDFDQCVGYFIVTKQNKDIYVDTSHMCDMIDY